MRRTIVTLSILLCCSCGDDGSNASAGSSSEATGTDGASTGSSSTGSSSATETGGSSSGSTGGSASTGGGTDSGSTSSETDGTTSTGSTGGGSGGSTGGEGWVVPSCTRITGSPGVGFTPDGGMTTLFSQLPFNLGKSYTWGIQPLEAPNVIVATPGNRIVRSVDGGCTWTEIGQPDLFPLRLVAGSGERAYAWGDNLEALYRIDGDTVTKLAPPTLVLGLGVDPDDDDHIRLGFAGGGQYESLDAGANWSKIGTAASDGVLGYRVAYDPEDLDHVVYGRATQGFYVTKDGGSSWTQSTGLTAGSANVNGFNAAISPVDGNVVWAEALDMGDNDKKFIYHSSDGGLTFAKVVDEDADVDITLTNGVHLIPHPTDMDVVYWVFGTCFSGYGTNLYRYSLGDPLPTWTNHPYADFGDLGFHPKDPTFIYIGLDGDDNPQCP